MKDAMEALASNNRELPCSQNSESVATRRRVAWKTQGAQQRKQSSFARCCQNRARIRTGSQRGRKLRRERGEDGGRVENKGFLDLHGKKRNNTWYNTFWIQCAFMIGL